MGVGLYLYWAASLVADITKLPTVGVYLAWGLGLHMGWKYGCQGV